MFAAPLWLAGLATLAIPLILHFWSRRPRQLIRVGSLRHVDGLAETRSWSARITEPLLLLVRLLLLTTVVLALAGPELGRPGLEGRTSQLILVEPALLRDSGLVAADPLLDSLARSRTLVRLLVPGLPKLQLDGHHTWLPEDLAAPGALWEELLEADRLVSPDGSLLVIARPRVVSLGGRRPSLTARVKWHVPSPVGEARWHASRWRVGPDSVIEVEGRGDARRTRYQLSSRETRCADCPALRRYAVFVGDADSIHRRRLRLAAVAAGSVLGLAVEPAKDASSADLLLGPPSAGSAGAAGTPSLSVSPWVIMSPGLADTLLARWPKSPLAVDTADPRQASLAQAMPGTRSPERLDPRNARAPLLLLALMLFAIERWLATRPKRSG